MAMYEMKPEYMTGIDFIDKEHAQLFSIANRAYELLKNEFIPDKYDYIVEVVEELKAYTKYHFKHEEEYMISKVTEDYYLKKWHMKNLLRKLIVIAQIILMKIKGISIRFVSFTK